MQNLYARVRLCPTAQRRTTGGAELPTIVDDWILELVSGDGVVWIKNVRTDHVATLNVDLIHHFDHEPHRDWDGLRHGLLDLRVQLVLLGANVAYMPLPSLRPRRGGSNPRTS